MNLPNPLKLLGWQKKILILLGKERSLRFFGDYAFSLPKAGASILTKIYPGRPVMRVRYQNSSNREVQSLLQEKVAYAMEKLLELINTSEQELGAYVRG